VQQFNGFLSANAPLLELAKHPFDVGHLLLYRHDVGQQIQSFLQRSSMVHLHGVNDGHDHRGLDHIPSQTWGTIFQGLKEYRGVVSLEVFSLEDLIPSLERIEEIIKGE
jgi:sugar phosphate isomerase/epimerase